LAVGVPDEDIGTIVDAGGVAVLMSYPPEGLTNSDEFWTQDAGTVTDQAEPGDHFGSALAVVQFPTGVDDHESDLAIGVPGEDTQSEALVDSGAVHVLQGDSQGGLTDVGQSFFTQSPPEQAGAQFGASLAGGTLSTGFTDYQYLAVGAPYGDVGAVADAGFVTTFYNGGSGEVWSQDSTNILDDAEAGDRFGSSLAGFRTTGTYSGLLVIGVPREDLGTVSDAGAIAVLYGPVGSHFSATDNQFWNQDSVGISGKAESGDRFGESAA